MPDGSRLSIRVLLARLVVLGLLPVAILSAWAVFNTLVAQRQATERSVLELSRALASAVDSELDATRQSLAAIGRSPALVRGDVRAFYDEARNEVAAHPEWSAVILTDAQGRLLFKTLLPLGASDSRIVDPGSLERTIRTGQPAVGLLLAGRTQPAFPVRMPVFIQGKLAYVVTAAVLPDRVLQVLRRQRAPRGWVIAVFDGAHARVARSKDQSSTVGGSALPQLARLFDRPGAEGSGVTETMEGESVYTGFTRLNTDGWIVAVGTPTAEMERVLLRSVAWYLAGILGSSLACFLLARRISRRISDGVNEIRNEAVQLSEGLALEGVRSDISEFDDMARAIASASHQLAEKARVADEALATANSAARAKDEFLAVLGHELRNPLAPMLTALQLIDMKAEGTADRERQIMRRQIDHMRRLVDDLLDISRITSGKFEIRRAPVSMTAVVERSVETVEPASRVRAAPIEVQLPEEPAWVMGDETRLVQAVSNLLSNALRYGGEGPIRLTLEASIDRVLLRVIDSGVGMDAETLARVFEPFFQAPQSSARKLGGLGLGLAIVRSIVTLHEGEVVAGSAGVGRGSWFSIDLPAVASSGAASKPESAHPQRRTGRVVIVDDNLDALEMITTALQTAGHEVHGISSSSEALERIPGLAPDVAILDLGMPVMDGFALAAALRGPDGNWTGRLVALTGYGQEADKARSKAAGFTLHLTKPVTIDALLSEIERLIRPPA